MIDKVLVLHEGEMLSFDTKEEALRLNPSLEDYFLAKVRDKRALWFCKGRLQWNDFLPT